MKSNSNLILVKLHTIGSKKNFDSVWNRTRDFRHESNSSMDVCIYKLCSESVVILLCSLPPPSFFLGREVYYYFVARGIPLLQCVSSSLLYFSFLPPTPFSPSLLLFLHFLLSPLFSFPFYSSSSIHPPSPPFYLPSLPLIFHLFPLLILVLSPP